MSLIIGITGILFGFHFYKKNKYASIGITYFSLMEIIQYFQYRVINECNNPENIFLTYLGYIHICFQPLFFNVWLFAFMKNPNFIFLYMCGFAGVLLASRLFFVKEDELCDNQNEPLCGNKTCAFSGEKHIAWNIRLRAPGKHWFTPSIGLHFFMWTVPAFTILQLKPILALLLTAPYLATITKNIHEQPAIWCYTAITQMLLSYYLIK